ncbi:MAG: transposase [Desulfamplus sp.]|nr:transposase [Desulfamplus sp.]
MSKIMPYLEFLSQNFPKQFVRLLGVVSQAMLCCKGRITMHGLSRWSGKGGSYRSIQRLYGSTVNWLQLNWLFFKKHRLKKDEVYLLAGDETTVTKSGKSTYGLGRFFSSIHGRAVKGLNFLSLCLVGVSSRQAVPLLMEPMDAGMKKETQVKKKPTKSKKVKKKKGTGPKGRRKGSKNKNRAKPELTPYLEWIQKQIKQTLAMIGDQIMIAYYVYDGAFGNNACLQMVRSCGLSMISKLQCNSALWYPYKGEYSGRGPRRKYGDKVDYRNIPEEFLKSRKIEDGEEERIYQIEVWHKDFPALLNVTVIQRIQLKDGKTGHVVLFSDDLELPYDKMILYYRLRFQIEFTFRDAKQYWGLEDFMNIKATQVKNAANIAMFMVNLSRFLTEQNVANTEPSILDIKIRAQTAFYLDLILKNNPEIAKVISFEELQMNLADIGCIHTQKKAA